MRVEVISVGGFEEEEIWRVLRIPRESELPEKILKSLVTRIDRRQSRRLESGSFGVSDRRDSVSLVCERY